MDYLRWSAAQGEPSELAWRDVGYSLTIIILLAYTNKDAKKKFELHHGLVALLELLATFPFYVMISNAYLRSISIGLKLLRWIHIFSVFARVRQL